VSLNTLATPTQSRINIVKKITNNEELGANNINLVDVFGWSIDLDGKGPDDRDPYSKYPAQALVIEGVDYRTSLLR